MENKERIKVASRRLGRICTGIMFFLPVVCILYWLFFNQIRHMPEMAHFPVPITGDLSGQIRLLAFCSDLPPLAVLVFSFYKLGSLFRLYENGHIFTRQNVDCFKSLGRMMIVWAACHFVSNSLMSIVLTLENPPGQRMLTLGLGSPEFGGLFVGGVVLTITWVMDEARKLNEDHELFI
jgi:hypothetical protein